MNLLLRMTPAERWLFGAFCVFSVWLCLIVGSVHDYRHYQNQWADIWMGLDPWVRMVDGNSVRNSNAYGPLNVLLAPVWAFYVMLPKVFFVGLVCAVFAILLDQSRKAEVEPNTARIWFVALMFPMLPLVVISIVAYGNNDIFPAFCLIMACALTTKDRPIGAGIWIGLGALMKFYPLIFAGFLVARQAGRLDFRTLSAAVFVFALGMAISFAFWGSSIFMPLQFGAERGPKMFSILRFLSAFEDLRGSAVLEHLIEKNAFYVLGVAALVALHGWLARLEWELTLLIGVLSVFAIYKVGHPQFFVSWVAVQAWILASRTEGPAYRVAWNLLPITALLAIFNMIYVGSDLLLGAALRGNLQVVRVGISPVFLALLMYCFFRSRHEVFLRWQSPFVKD